MGSAGIELLILDVDGVLTDGRVASSVDGEAGKAFFVQDGFAVKVWQRAGGKVAILSGRGEPAVEARARELGIALIRTGATEKLSAYESLLSEAGVEDAAVAYVGDDIPDLAPMARCAFPIAVANASGEVKRVAHFVTRRRGGEGAVAEVVEHLLRMRGRWSRSLFEGI